MLLAVVIALVADVAQAGKVKQALFSGVFGSSSKSAGERPVHTDAEQEELVQFLTDLGYAKYATKEFIEKLDDELACDSIEDLTYLIEDDDYRDIGMDKADAEFIENAARKEILRRFLLSVPVPQGEPSDVFVKLLDRLIEAGYEEPDDVADLEEDESDEVGIKKEHIKILVKYADEYEGRELYRALLTTYQPVTADAVNPFASESVWRPLMEKLVAAGLRTLDDVGSATEVPGVSAADLSLLRNDPRVQAHMTKQEL